MSTRPTIPLVLGVVGHRRVRPQDDAALRTAVDAVLAEMLRAHPHTPLVVLSALAEGADQLVAEVALRKAGTPEFTGRLGVSAPLPLPAAVYRETTSFVSDDGRQRFDALLADASVDAFVVPLPDGPADDDLSAWQLHAQEPDFLRRCYANSGGIIVRRCHVLLALWDGKLMGRASGTEEYVNFKLTGQPPRLYPWPGALGFDADSGPVCVLHTPRAGTVDERPAGSRIVQVPGGGSMPDGALMVAPPSRTARFWSRVRSSLGLGLHSHDGHHAAERELRQLRDIGLAVDDCNADLSEASNVDDALARAPDMGVLVDTTSPVRSLLQLRAATDALSRKLETSLRHRQLLLFGTVLLAIASFHLYAHLFQPAGDHTTLHDPRWLGLYLIALLGLVGLVSHVWTTRLDQRRLDYRALAEALRVRIFWALAGVGQSVADSYLAQLRGEIAWARRALQNACPPPASWAQAFRKLAPSEQCKRLEVVRQDWVRDQADFYRRSHDDNHRWATRSRRTGLAFAVTGWLLAGLLLVPTVDLVGSAVHPAHWVLIASSLLVVAGGLLLAYSERRAHEELARQYDRMRALFERGDEALCEAIASGDVATGQQIVVELGREAITEHAHWLILRRARPFEIHIG